MSKARDIARAGTALSNVDATELGYLDGVTSNVQTQLDGKQAANANVSTTELGYLDGVTSAIQTQIDNKISNSLVDAKGDLIAATANDTVSRLAVGTDGQILTADSTAATGLKWATATSGANWSLLNSGGTAMSGSSTVTISGISGKNQLKVLVYATTTSATAVDISMTLNNDTTSANYKTVGNMTIAYATYTPQDFWGYDNTGFGHTAIFLAKQSGGTSSSDSSAAVEISGTNTSGIKAYSVNGGSTSAGVNFPSNRSYNTQGIYTGTSTISSVEIKVSSGTFTGGTVYVYGSAN